MDLLKHPEKLGEILDTLIEELQSQKMLPGKLTPPEMMGLRKQVLTVLLKSGGLALDDQSLKFLPGDPLIEQQNPLNLMHLLILTVTSESLKKSDFKLLFGESSDDPKEKALIEKLMKALKKLKDAKNPEEANAAFDEVMKVCDELSNRPGVKASLKLQIEMVRMMAHQMKNDVINEPVHLLQPQPGSRAKQEEEDDFSFYLRNLYGGIDPRFGGLVATVTTVLSNDNAYGSDNAGDPNDLSQVAEANRFDFHGDSGGRENAIMQRLVGLGGALLEVLHESRLLTPTPTNTLDHSRD